MHTSAKSSREVIVMKEYEHSHASDKQIEKIITIVGTANAFRMGFLFIQLGFDL